MVQISEIFGVVCYCGLLEFVLLVIIITFANLSFIFDTCLAVVFEPYPIRQAGWILRLNRLRESGPVGSAFCVAIIDKSICHDK